MSRLGRLLLFSLLLCGLSAWAHAAEEIRNFRVEIDVASSGDIQVTEKITVNAEGRSIRRGIFRELPRYYLDEATGGKLPYRYDILSIERDERPEPYEIETEDNAVRLRIGSAERFLSPGEYTYTVTYTVKNQIRYGAHSDELYWNVTGTHSIFPILRAEAVVTLPEGATVLEAAGYTGRAGASGRNFTYRQVMDAHLFETTQALAPREGLTLSLGIQKGAIEPPSMGDHSWLWWARNGALSVLILSFLGVLVFYRRSFERVGRDPPKGPVFPQYDAPEGYSPAAAHYIYYRGFRGHGALIASLMQLGVTGHLKIDVQDKFWSPKTTSLSLIEDPGGTPSLPADTVRLADDIFSWRANLEFDGDPNPDFVEDYDRYKGRLKSRYGSPYFNWNFGYVLIGAGLTLAAIVFALVQASYWTVWHTVLILALIGLNGLFMYLMPAPTRKGQDIRTHLEGLRLYMEKAEALQLNTAETDLDAPPPMTTERYERFLPYAVALGVEKPWSKHFENLIPDQAAHYNPAWAHLGRGGFGSIGGMTEGIVSGITTGVASAQPQSSGSSGLGGGGVSGGGGGGGGVGGW